MTPASEAKAREEAGRSCTCHPDEAPVPCQKKYAFSECRKAETEALRARVRELTEALSELLEACESDYGIPDEGDEDDEAVAASSTWPVLTTFGHLRRARAALNPVAQPEERQPSKRQVAGSSPAGVANGWQPIETAPKDGTLVDLWLSYPLSGKGRRIPYALWEDEAWRDDDNSDPLEWGPDQYGQSCIATHWRPLPPPPTADAEGER